MIFTLINKFSGDYPSDFFVTGMQGFPQSLSMATLKVSIIKLVMRKLTLTSFPIGGQVCMWPVDGTLYFRYGHMKR